MKDSLIKKIANDLVNIGSNNTMTGNYHISFSDVADAYGINLQEVIDNKKAIADEIDKHEEILSETWIEEDFDMNFCFDDGDC